MAPWELEYIDLARNLLLNMEYWIDLKPNRVYEAHLDLLHHKSQYDIKIKIDWFNSDSKNIKIIK